MAKHINQQTLTDVFNQINHVVERISETLRYSTEKAQTKKNKLLHPNRLLPQLGRRLASVKWIKNHNCSDKCVIGHVSSWFGSTDHALYKCKSLKYYRTLKGNGNSKICWTVILDAILVFNSINSRNSINWIKKCPCLFLFSCLSSTSQTSMHAQLLMWYW